MTDLPPDKNPLLILLHGFFAIVGVLLMLFAGRCGLILWSAVRGGR